MLTKNLIWDNLLYKTVPFYSYITPFRIFICLFFSIFTIPLDILLLPLEIIALIIFKLIPNNKED